MRIERDHEITVRLRNGDEKGVLFSRRRDAEPEFRRFVSEWAAGRVFGIEGEDFAWAINPADVVSISYNVLPREVTAK